MLTSCSLYSDKKKTGYKLCITKIFVKYYFVLFSVHPKKGGNIIGNGFRGDNKFSYDESFLKKSYILLC